VNKGRGLLIWVLCLGILWLAYVGGQVHPVAFLLAGVLLPLPVLWVGWRLGSGAALLLALATVLVIFLLKPGWSVILENLGFGELLLMGVLIAALQNRGLSTHQAIILTVVGVNLLALLIFLGEAFFAGVGPQALLTQKSQELLQTLYRVLGDTAGEAPGQIFQDFSQADLEKLVPLLLPGLVVVNSGLVAWINVILARQLIRLGGGAQPQPPLFYWSTPEWLIFVLLGAGFLLLVPLTGVRLLSLNLLMVLALLYFCQGVAVIAAWFNRLGLPPLLRLIAYPLLFLNPLVLLIITLGLMDLWLDFRRLHQPKDA
jgi:uncharacterized protein YybS (DUF2232 family)